MPQPSSQEIPEEPEAPYWVCDCASEGGLTMHILHTVFGIGVARWPDGPPQSGVAQGCNLIPVSGVGEAVGGVNEAVGDEKIGGKGGSKEHSTKT